MTLRVGFVSLLCASMAITTSCTGQSATSTSTTASWSRTTTTPVGSSPSTSRETARPGTNKAPPGDRESITDLVGFTSPTGNVGCYLDSTTARCDIGERDWAPPPRPADCEFDYGQGITLSAGESPAFVCAGDTTFGSGAPLAYGQSIAAGVLRCESTEAGITCIDLVTSHGFSIAREGYRLF